MRESRDVLDGMLRFYDRISASDVGSFEKVVELGPGTLTIGTAPGEWVTEPERLRYGFEAEGLRIEAGPNPIGYEEGSLGWVVDEPVFYFPDGAGMKTRLTAVLHRTDELWRLVHMHVSVGVPDEEVPDLQRRWGTGIS